MTDSQVRQLFSLINTYDNLQTRLYCTDIIRILHYKWSPLEKHPQTGGYFTFHQLLSPSAFLFPLFPLNFIYCQWPDTVQNTIFYLCSKRRHKANKNLQGTQSTTRFARVHVCRLIGMLCVVISAECSLTNILTYLVQLVLH